MPHSIPLSHKEESLLRTRHAGRIHYGVYRRIHEFGNILSLGIVALCGLIMAGYVLGLEFLYQPVPDLPGMHPLTTLLIAGLALVQYCYVPMRPMATPCKIVLWTVLALALIRLFEIVSGVTQVGLSPALDQLLGLNAQTGPSASTGMNTVLATLCIAGSYVLRRRWSGLAFFMATLAPMFPLMGLVGHSFQADSFYGEMPSPTALLLLPLGLGVVLNFGHSASLRPVFGDSTVGKFLRIQLLAAFAIPWGGGMLYYIGSAIYGPGMQGIVITTMVWGFLAVIISTSRAYENSDKNRRLTERKLVVMSSRDPLTLLLNRQGMFERFVDMQPGQFGVFLIDLDGFKTVNDKYGHAAGDEVLRRAARMLDACVRSTDLVGRWGGEEFLVVAAEMDEDRAIRLAEDLRRCLALTDHGSIGPVTASIGVTLMRPWEKSLARVVDRADAALYEAKDQGRDRIIATWNAVRDPDQKIPATTPVEDVKAPKASA
ncbi:GGDEF domain-containing protein [Aliiroseovarius sp. PTFE2010]|uniref:GGDEF domain-containing protein n=1 Tax=Aliiroseovarius sp. PTFE2010 TaxID=3417190 RepID=UPI003CF09C1A